jgi:excisionase family DNA binding protein
MRLPPLSVPEERLMPKRPDPLLTTKEAAARLGLKPRAVQFLCEKEILPAQKLGRTWVIRESDLHHAENRPKRGRRWPKKKETP